MTFARPILWTNAEREETGGFCRLAQSSGVAKTFELMMASLGGKDFSDDAGVETNCAALDARPLTARDIDLCTEHNAHRVSSKWAKFWFRQQ